MHDGRGENDLLNPLDKFRRGRLTEQGRDGVPRRVVAAPEDEKGHQRAGVGVDVDVREMGDERGDEHRQRRAGVAQTVRGRRAHGRGVDLFADGAVVEPHVELDEDGRRQHPHTEPAEHHCRRVQHFERGFFQQRKPDGEDGDADHETRQIFVPGVAVGVLFVRAFGRQTEAHEAHHVGRGVREVVQGIGHDGDGTEQRAHGELAQAEQNIAHHAHDAGQIAIGGPGARVLRIVGVTDKQTDQQLRHKKTLFFKIIKFNFFYIFYNNCLIIFCNFFFIIFCCKIKFSTK